METTSFKVYKYRWVMLVVYMLIVAVNQLLWITFAPVTSDAVRYYHVSDIQIGILSMSFMIVFIVMSVPASWIIDKYGIKTGVGIGALFTGAFGLMRGLVGDDYNLVLVAQTGIAIGQPFLLNAITKLAARWFPMEERATAAGLGTLAMYIGILIAMILTPLLAGSHGISGTLYIYGIISVVATFIFLIFAKENPPTAPCHPDQEERSLVLDGLKDTLSNKTFYFVLIIFFIGLGIFNSVTTWIEDIVRPRDFSATQAGIAGGLMILGGIIGAVIMPMLSDHYKKRVPFIIIALLGSTIGLIGIAYATNFVVLLTSSFIFGYFLLSAGPIGFQYGAEITYPTSEGTSNGLILLAGQISGIAFIFGMDSFKSSVTGSMSIPLTFLIVLMVVATGLSLRLKESTLLVNKENID
jgi:cyanate permease